MSHYAGGLPKKQPELFPMVLGEPFNDSAAEIYYSFASSGIHDPSSASVGDVKGSANLLERHDGVDLRPLYGVVDRMTKLVARDTFGPYFPLRARDLAARLCFRFIGGGEFSGYNKKDRGTSGHSSPCGRVI